MDEKLPNWLTEDRDHGRVPQNAINRRFKRVLARFTNWSILLVLGAALGVGLLRFGLPGRN